MILTMDEVAAEHLHAGRKKLFDDAALVIIKEAMRCPSSSSRRAKAKPRFGVRGTYLGIAVERSTKTTERETARGFLRKWKNEIERGCFAKPGEPTFVDAVAEYIAATGNERFIKKLAEHFGFTFLRKIKQKEIDEAAIVLYPTATAATRNRQVHTIMSAILKHAEIDRPLKRPRIELTGKSFDLLLIDEVGSARKALPDLEIIEIEPVVSEFLHGLCLRALQVLKRPSSLHFSKNLLIDYQADLLHLSRSSPMRKEDGRSYEITARRGGKWTDQRGHQTSRTILPRV